MHDAAVMLRCLQGQMTRAILAGERITAISPAGGKASGYTGGDGISSIIGQDLEKDNMLVYVRFRPESQLVYCERITFQTSAGLASVTLAGQGVSPILELTPAVSNVLLTDWNLFVYMPRLTRLLFLFLPSHSHTFLEYTGRQH